MNILLSVLSNVVMINSDEKAEQEIFNINPNLSEQELKIVVGYIRKHISKRITKTFLKHKLKELNFYEMPTNAKIIY